MMMCVCVCVCVWQYGGGDSDAERCCDCSSPSSRTTSSSSSSSSSMTSVNVGTEPASSASSAAVNKTNLIVNYLPQSLSQDDMLALFNSVAQVDSCKLVRDKTTGMSSTPLACQWRHCTDTHCTLTSEYEIPIIWRHRGIVECKSDVNSRSTFKNHL